MASGQFSHQTRAGHRACFRIPPYFYILEIHQLLWWWKGLAARGNNTATDKSSSTCLIAPVCHLSKDSLQFDIQIYFGYKYAVRCHRHANNTELHSPWFVNSYDSVLRAEISFFFRRDPSFYNGYSSKNWTLGRLKPASSSPAWSVNFFTEKLLSTDSLVSPL